MTCKEFEKMIPAFIDEKLDLSILKKFSEHMSSCDECREELVIQFLVTEGMQHLEDGDSFDLQNELDARLERARSRVKFHSVFLCILAGLETLAVALVAGVVVWIMV